MNVEEIDPRNYVLELSGLIEGNALMNRFGMSFGFGIHF
jgi:hypothetical protein